MLTSFCLTHAPAARFSILLPGAVCVDSDTPPATWLVQAGVVFASLPRRAYLLSGLAFIRISCHTAATLTSGPTPATHLARLTGFVVYVTTWCAPDTDRRHIPYATWLVAFCCYQLVGATVMRSEEEVMCVCFVCCVGCMLLCIIELCIIEVESPLLCMHAWVYGRLQRWA